MLEDAFVFSGRTDVLSDSEDGEGERLRRFEASCVSLIVLTSIDLVVFQYYRSISL